MIKILLLAALGIFLVQRTYVWRRGGDFWPFGWGPSIDAYWSANWQKLLFLPFIVFALLWVILPQLDPMWSPLVTRAVNIRAAILFLVVLSCFAQTIPYPDEKRFTLGVLVAVAALVVIP